MVDPGGAEHIGEAGEVANTGCAHALRSYNGLDVYLDYLHEIRRDEVRRVLELLPEERGDLLEVGAGTGFQAGLLQAAGFRVRAVDLDTSSYAADRVFPVESYDGHRLPCEDASFDRVFSSNVLEHVVHLEALLEEQRRVLRPGGMVLHVLPTPVWRVASICGHLPARALRALGVSPVRKHGSASPTAAASVSRKSVSRKSGTPRSWLARVGGALGLKRHGERGNALSEIYLFSQGWWLRRFRAAGWQVERAEGIGLFYSGQMLLGPRLSLPARRQLARWLGSVTQVFLLRP